MPGLLRGVARTAVIAGTATSVSNRVSRRQYDRWAEQDAQQEPAPAASAPEPAASAPAPSDPTPSAQAPGAGSEDRLAQLKQLGDLKAQGILTEEEFAAEKARILGS